MSRQEEIREDVARTFYENSDVSKTIAWRDLPEGTRNYFFYKADSLIYRLSEAGCVLKVEGKVPEWLKFKWARNPACTSQEAVDEQFAFDLIEEAKYTLTESLVEGK